MPPEYRIMEEKRTELSELGEFGLIDKLAKSIELKNESSVLGIGDDAAVIDRGEEFGLLSTDMLVEGIHFDLSYCPLPHLGYKAIAVNVSDIAAMNGNPEQVTVSLALSNRFSVEAVDALFDGMRAAASDYNVDIVGETPQLRKVAWLYLYPCSERLQKIKWFTERVLAPMIFFVLLAI